MQTEGIRARVPILVLVTVLIVCSLAPMANAETVTRGCDAAQCFNTQFSLHDIDKNRSDFLYEINDYWYDNYTALELMTKVLDTQNMTFSTAQQNGGTVFMEVNGTTSNSSWEWAVYLDEDGMWVSTSLTADQIVIKNVDNYAVCLIPYAGGEHNPFSQSVGDWLEDNAVDEYIHSTGNVSSDGKLVGTTSFGSAWTVRTSGELLGTNLTEIEMRVEGGEEGDELMASMIISNGTENVTHPFYWWWEMTWNDADGDGEYSVGDAWEVRTDFQTHGGDYYATFVRIGSCDWGWTDSGCPDGQICSDGTCTDETEDENETLPMDYWAHTELGRLGHLNVTLEAQSMDSDVPIAIEYRVRHDLVIDDEPHMTDLGGDDIPMLTDQSTFNQTFEVEIDNGAGSYCVSIYLRLPDGNWIRPSQNYPGALSCIGVPESHWDNMTEPEPEPEPEPEEEQHDSGESGLPGFSLLLTLLGLIVALVVSRRKM